MNAFVSDSECDSTETSDSEDQDDSESTYNGHAQSILSSLDESIGKIDDFLAYERGFLHGDIISSISDPSGQLGRVVNVDMTVDLETPFGEVIKYVNSKILQRIWSFASGDYVVHGSWLGRVDRVVDVVTVMFDDGIRCEILVDDSEVLVPVSPMLFEDAPCPYSPGQRVRVKLPTISKSVQWLCGGSAKSRQDEGTIFHVEVGLVHVNWITTVMGSHDVITSTPPIVQDPKYLTLLSCFSHANWQLGDWCTLPSSYFHSMQIAAQKLLSSGIVPQCFAEMPKISGSSGQYCQQIYVIVKIRTKVDVLWQNGSHSLGMDSQTLLPVNNVGDHEFWPEQFVLEKAISENMNDSNGQRVGIVKYVDAEERTVKVKWMVPEIKLDVVSIEESNEETLSAYELIEHPDFSYCIGDIVFRLLPHCENSYDNRIDVQTNGWSLRRDVPLKGVLNSSLLLRKDTLKTSDEEFARYLSCIGNVIGFKDEAIEVRWASGLISKVQPSEIFGLDKVDDTPSLPAIIEEAVPEISTKEMADQEKQPCLEKEQAVTNYSEYCKKDVWKARQFTLAAIGFITNIATTIFSSRGSASLSGPYEGNSELQILKVEKENLDVDVLQPDSLKQQVEVHLNEQPTFSPCMNSVKFKKFDIVDDSSDHHFANGISKGMLSLQVKRSWLKKVQQEWSILRKDLPESIYVRVYEERIDILRACIVGASGTPYHDGLFFFDIFFPSDYPQEPPLVHYQSGGLRLNPNLYESGKVCLSLLKTWMGSGTEVWNPESSTILQVLLSLQALVLNDRPYFNEAGYDQQVGRAEGEKNSITYNENAFLLSCKSMLYILYRPPKHFEALVEEHFAHRSLHILISCKAYMDGAQVGCALEDEEVEGKSVKSSSIGFKIMLAKLVPRLILGFTEKGIDCSQFIDGSEMICNTSTLRLNLAA